jgi:hypothetical protein
MKASVELDHMTLHFTATLDRDESGDDLTDITLDCVEILGTDVTAFLPRAVLEDLSGIRPDAEDFK